MKRRTWIVACVFFAGAAFALGYAVRRAHAAGIPATNALTYAGVLESVSGPLSGSHNIGVSLYDADTAGNLLCQVPSAPLMIVNGEFNVQLPDTCTTAVAGNPNVWIDVAVDGASVGRTKIGAVPYAVEANRASAAAGVLATQVVPAGAVMFFNLASCPTGWAPMTEAAGRYIVGLDSKGKLAATVGTALADEEDRPVGMHSHSVSDPGHGHGVNDPGHGHGVNDPGHAHGVSAGAFYVYWNNATCSGASFNINSGAAGNCVDVNGGTGGAGTNISIQGSGTGISIQAGTTGIGVNNAGTVAGTNAPYVQLLACQKQ